MEGAGKLKWQLSQAQVETPGSSRKVFWGDFGPSEAPTNHVLFVSTHQLQGPNAIATLGWWKLVLQCIHHFDVYCALPHSKSLVFSRSKTLISSVDQKTFLSFLHAPADRGFETSQPMNTIACGWPISNVVCVVPI